MCVSIYNLLKNFNLYDYQIFNLYNKFLCLKDFSLLKIFFLFQD